MTPSLLCTDARRRVGARAGRRNGMDYVEVGNGTPCILTVFLFGAPPDTLTAANVRIDGGRRIRNVRATSVRLPNAEENNDFIEITLNKPGDFSTYTLRLVQTVEGRPGDTPLEGFDPRYARLDFEFKVDCPTDLDCLDDTTCPPVPRVEPAINYLAKDYASFRQLLLDRWALLLPDWQERHVPDLGITLVELLAYIGDYLSYYQDAVATEAYLQTARERISVRRHTRLIDYPMHEGCNARSWVVIGTQRDLPVFPNTFYFITGDKAALGTDAIVLDETALHGIPFSHYEAFEPVVASSVEPIQLVAAHSRIQIYTWGDEQCCLPRGTTSATLRDSPPDQNISSRPGMPSGPGIASGPGTVSAPGIAPDQPITSGQGSAPDRNSVPDSYLENQKASLQEGRQGGWLHLKVGDVLIFEEALGPVTGNAADADRTHRHAVRLTGVENSRDPLYDQPVVEITWDEADALPFALCLSAIGNAPTCELLHDISVARGNVFLVEHGRRIDDESQNVVGASGDSPAGCDDESLPQDVTPIPARFRPQLKQAPLTFHTAWSGTLPATGLLRQDPRACMPWLAVTTDEIGNSEWTFQFDLLESSEDDNHFVVEMDNNGSAHLRFGDGELGRVPGVGTSFTTLYYVGNGRAGNVGRDSITHIVFRSNLPNGAVLTVTNPLPAQGGVEPESLAEVKMLAPGAIHGQLERAITPDDYARLAERVPHVRRATANRGWTGSWYQMHVGIQPFGMEDVDPGLLDAVYTALYPYRRLGYDLAIAPAAYVPLFAVIEVCVQPDVLRGHVKAALSDLFSSRLLPDGRRGLFHPDNLSFGESVRASRLVAAAQAVAGVESVSKIYLRHLFGERDNEAQDGVLPIGPLEVAQLDNDPNFPEHGKLTLNVRGGR